VVWIDITRPLGPALPVFPGDEPPLLERFEAGGSAMTRLTLLTHTGTHLDLPAHVLRRSRKPDEPAILESLIGPARVVGVPAARSPVIGLPILRELLGPRPPARVLLCTRPGRKAWRGLDPEAAAWLAGRCRLVGTDAVSIDPPGPGLEAHRLLLARGTLVLENLQLEVVRPGAYHLVALPLRVKVPDGAPVRALLRAGRGTDPGRGGKRE
jgi:arylformamidase